MKLVETEYVRYDYDYGEERTTRLSVKIVDEEGDVIGSVALGEGEPEDMTLQRDLFDVYYIADLVAKANELGLKGIKLERVSKTEE